MRNAPSVASFIGRSAAACVHPYAAWRLKPGPVRLVILSAYAAAGYVLVLGALLML